MTLYVLIFDNGLEYADREVTELGYYTTPEKRVAAEERYRSLWGKQWPMTAEGQGEFVRRECEADTDLYPECP